MRTLVLNKNWMPITHISWKRAFVLLCKGSAELLETYEEVVKTPSTYLPIPAVIKLNDYGDMPKARISYSKRTLLERDDYTCQYCGTQLSFSNATVDHVFPRSKGGKTTFENTVISCLPCNTAKGSKLLDQTKLKLKNKPRKPAILDYEIYLPQKISKQWTNYIPKGLLNGVQIVD